MLILIISSLLLALGLGELYKWWQGFLGVSGWLAILCLHAMLTLVLLTCFGGLRRQLKIGMVGLLGFAPATFVLVGALILAFVFPHPGEARGLSWAYLIAACTLIPFVEEVVFRGGISALLDRVQPSGWSGYFSAMVFSLAHASPSLDNWLSLKVGLPLGPFLLGLVCEYLARRTKSLLPSIAFHCACNSTVIIFNQWSPGWFDRLSAFYLG